MATVIQTIEISFCSEPINSGPELGLCPWVWIPQACQRLQMVQGGGEAGEQHSPPDLAGSVHVLFWPKEKPIWLEMAIKEGAVDVGATHPAAPCAKGDGLYLHLTHGFWVLWKPQNCGTQDT